MTKQLILLSSVKTSRNFFQIFVAFPEKLDFNRKGFGPYDGSWVKGAKRHKQRQMKANSKGFREGFETKANYKGPTEHIPA